MAQGSM
jgi:hypothetical protein